ncbi:alternative ribosome rescue factor ArfA [Entomomonas asaccharolytica]|uniref:Ribosome alternative rescue factor ArfA n=1 Tax=Entomomonas asaccharolytica TaxID=2785331 RepID=A0A974RW00_9GAMM|nr:alternative ribosome rescue factor ArfA [Entomomonas asaccharolytica]QQP84635.1 ribosome alternative rescue factor ArfA [Entomomonas asaccharolytica]
MSKKMRREPSKAKRLVMQPQFRSFSEKPAKGKGSYNRKASRNNRYDEAFAA